MPPPGSVMKIEGKVGVPLRWEARVPRSKRALPDHKGLRGERGTLPVRPHLACVRSLFSR